MCLSRVKVLLTEDPELALLLHKARSATVDPELSGSCLAILALLVYYERDLSSDAVIAALVDMSVDPKARPHRHLLDRAVAELLAKRIGLPDTFLAGQAVYYGAACLLRRGAALARTAAGKKAATAAEEEEEQSAGRRRPRLKSVPRLPLVAWASKIPFFAPLVGLLATFGLASVGLTLLALPFFFASPSRSLSTEVESTIWLYLLVLLALAAIFATWANNDRPFGNTVRPAPVPVDPNMPEAGWPPGEEPAQPRLCGLWRYTRPDGR
eukprot:SAG22_NODE_1234_length_5061_cov_4.711004_3_plen_268_part_00